MSNAIQIYRKILLVFWTLVVGASAALILLIFSKFSVFQISEDAIVISALIYIGCAGLLFLWMVTDMLKSNSEHKALWVILFLLGSVFTAIFYFYWIQHDRNSSNADDSLLN